MSTNTGGNGTPSLSGISISSGIIGDSVTIYGNNFSTIPSDNKVQFAGVTAVVVSSSPTSLVVIVPPGTMTGNVTVTVNGQASSNTQHFTVLSANVYSAGDANNGQIGVYFRNGNIAGIISSPLGSVALTGIYVSGHDIYVSGIVENGTGSVKVTFPAYWKNGTEVDLAKTGVTSGIWVSGGDIYVSGGVDGTGIHYWKNGNLISLSGGGYGGTTAISVSGSDVYVAGTYNDNQIGQVSAYWKNGVQVSLPGNTSYTRSIYVLGNDVYVTGQTYSGGYRTGVYWKNGVKVNLSDGRSDVVATGIYILGTDVYVAGYESGTDSYPFYWKNGTKVGLTPGPGSTIGISGTGNDIYIGCDGYSLAPPAAGVGFGFWYNGTFENITVPVTILNQIVGIFVKSAP